MSRWVFEAIKKIESDYQRSADTHLFKLEIPKLEGVEIYLKDESMIFEAGDARRLRQSHRLPSLLTWHRWRSQWKLGTQ